MSDSINFKYKNKDFISSIRRLSTIDYIMTQNIKYYEDFQDIKQAITFCIEKDIDTLPSMHGNNIYQFDGNIFIKKRLETSNTLGINDNIFDSSVMSSFSRQIPLRYIFNESNLVGIMHFSDYNRNPSYTYLYSVISELENNIRNIFEKVNIGENEIIDYLIEKRPDVQNKLENKKTKESYKHYPYQIFEFSELIYYYNHLVKNKIITNEKIKDTLRFFRNDIMHNKLLVKLKNYETGKLDFDFNSFESFRENVFELFNALEITNKELSD